MAALTPLRPSGVSDPILLVSVPSVISFAGSDPTCVGVAPGGETAGVGKEDGGDDGGGDPPPDPGGDDGGGDPPPLSSSRNQRWKGKKLSPSWSSGGCLRFACAGANVVGAGVGDVVGAGVGACVGSGVGACVGVSVVGVSVVKVAPNTFDSIKKSAS
jgi:hypothetical protein